MSPLVLPLAEGPDHRATAYCYAVVRVVAGAAPVVVKVCGARKDARAWLDARDGELRRTDFKIRRGRLHVF